MVAKSPQGAPSAKNIIYQNSLNLRWTALVFCTGLFEGCQDFYNGYFVSQFPQPSGRKGPQYVAKGHKPSKKLKGEASSTPNF